MRVRATVRRRGAQRLGSAFSDGTVIVNLLGWLAIAA